MRISETTLSFLENDCIQRFGNSRGKIIFHKAEMIYSELCEKAEYRNSAVISQHLQQNLFPPMAYYKALQSEEIPQMAALEYVRQETQKAANFKKAEMKKLTNLPFTYTLYRLGAKKHMRRNFPDEGWKTEWIKFNGKEIHFNLHRCIYWELTNKYACPELCCVYCENDNISFSGLLPKIRFERNGTLGNGSPYCDFHFIKI